MNESITIGVLGIQGDIEENINACKKALKEMQVLGEVKSVKKFDEIKEIDGLIIPGGESTVISTLLFLQKDNLELLKQKISEEMPVLGTCAGMIILAKKSQDKKLGDLKQNLLAILDINIERNAFGRQHESFEAKLNIPSIGDEQYKGIFIRGPIVKEIGKDVIVLSKYNDLIVAVQQNNIIATSFHPELVEDTRIQKQFIKKIIETKSKNNK